MHSDLTKKLAATLPYEDDHVRLTDSDSKGRRNQKKKKR